MKITFLGASEEVTGSGYLVESKKNKFLVDFGIFQGGDSKKNYEKNLELGFDPKEIDFVLLTHAHLDHSGRLPLLAKNGFKGEIFATHSTIALSEIVLFDSAKIQNENLKNSLWSKKEDFLQEPIYVEKDVKRVIKQFRKISFRKKLKIGKGGVEVEFFKAGHILGASSIRIFVEGKFLTFSGDIGRAFETIVPTPDRIPKSNFLVVESTYGDRDHKNIKESYAELLKVCKKVIFDGGNLLIPSFAIDRTQELLMIFDKWSKEKILNVPVILDSPMAKETTMVYKTHISNLSQNTQNFALTDKSLFWFPELKVISSYQDSLKTNSRKGQIIIAGSGMCTGGRILNHLKENLPNPKSAICFVGFQAEGTLGREILEKKPIVSIFGEDVGIKSQIFTINGFSAHAGKREIIDWIEQINEKEKIFITHGETLQRESLKTEIQKNFNGEIFLPKRFETFEI